MEHNDQLHVEAEEALANINKKTGRNMPQAVATGAVLVIIILASLLIRIDVFVLLIVVFMVLALWELRVDFATVGLHIPVVALWLCSAAILLGTYYSPYHFGTMALLTMATLMLVAILATARFSFGNWLSLAVASKLSSSDAAAREQSSFNHEKGELHHSRLSHVAVSILTVLYIPTLASCIVLSLVFNGHPVAHAITLVFLPALSDTGGLFFVGVALVGSDRHGSTDRRRRHVRRPVRVHAQARYRHQGYGTPAQGSWRRDGSCGFHPHVRAVPGRTAVDCRHVTVVSTIGHDDAGSDDKIRTMMEEQ